MLFASSLQSSVSTAEGVDNAVRLFTNTTNFRRMYSIGSRGLFRSVSRCARFHVWFALAFAVTFLYSVVGVDEGVDMSGFAVGLRLANYYLVYESSPVDP